MERQNEHFGKKSPKSKKKIKILHFMTTFHNVALKIETSFKLQWYLSTLWKLEKSIINVKWDMLKMPPEPLKVYIRPEENVFVV